LKKFYLKIKFFLAERSRLLGKEIASSFIREESSQLESILNGSIANRK